MSFFEQGFFETLDQMNWGLGLALFVGFPTVAALDAGLHPLIGTALGGAFLGYMVLLSMYFGV